MNGQKHNLKPTTPARLLVAEADAAIGAAMKRVLEGAGYEVWVAADGPDGLRQLASGAIDLVVLDLDTFREEEVLLGELLAQPAGRVPILLLSAVATHSLVREATRIGALLEKPTDAMVLLKTAAALLQEPSERWVSTTASTRRCVLRLLRVWASASALSRLPYRGYGPD